MGNGKKGHDRKRCGRKGLGAGFIITLVMAGLGIMMSPYLGQVGSTHFNVVGQIQGPIGFCKSCVAAPYTSDGQFCTYTAVLTQDQCSSMSARGYSCSC